MQLPYFFEENIPIGIVRFTMSEESSRHIVQVLRMKEKENLLITNGKGNLLTASIINPNKKNAEVQILNTSYNPGLQPGIIIGISLIKNRNRFEWFLEKATEIGVTAIIPFISDRTEKQQFRHERMKSILVSAMLQSQQTWLPRLQEPLKFSDLIRQVSIQNKFIAHCIQNEKENLSNQTYRDGDSLILIGPEGDFTKEEIEMALQNNYIPVSLGQTRLRTETAGLVAAVLLNNKLTNS